MNRWNTINYKCVECGCVIKVTVDEDRRLQEGLFKLKPCKCGSKNFKKIKSQQMTF